MTKKIIKSYTKFETGSVCIVLNKEVKTKEEHDQFHKELEEAME